MKKALIQQKTENKLKKNNPDNTTAEENKETSAPNTGELSTDGVSTDKCTTAGDPVNVTTGSFYIEAVDLVIEALGMDLNIMRRYKSIENHVGVMGKG